MSNYSMIYFDCKYFLYELICKNSALYFGDTDDFPSLWQEFLFIY